jgi:hypothetical protein
LHTRHSCLALLTSVIDDNPYEHALTQASNSAEEQLCISHISIPCDVANPCAVKLDRIPALKLNEGILMRVLGAASCSHKRQAQSNGFLDKQHFE